MNESTRKLRALPARPIYQILDALQSASIDEVKAGEMKAPRVTLLLRSGREIFGRVTALREVRGSATVLMQTGGDNRWDMGSDVTYIPFESVEAIIVHDAPSHVELLSDGAVQSIDPPPTRLNARRMLETDKQAAITAMARQLDWSTPIDELEEGDGLRALTQLSASTASVLTELMNDALGREALNGITGVRFEKGALSAGKVASFLVVRSPMQQERIDAVSLKTVIEAAL